MAMIGRLIFCSSNKRTAVGKIFSKDSIEARLAKLPGFQSAWHFDHRDGDACGVITRWQSAEDEQAGFEILAPYIAQSAEFLGAGHVATYRFEYAE